LDSSDNSVANLKQQYVSSHVQISGKPGLLMDTDSKDALWRVIRKLSDDSAMLVVLALDENGKMTSRELHDDTKLPVSNINHALTDLKAMKVIEQDRESKKYKLTKYGKVILGALDNLLTKISQPKLWSEPLRVDNELSNGNSWRESHEKDQTALRPRIQDISSSRA